MGRGLSSLQVNVLQSMLHYYRHVEKHGSEWLKRMLREHVEGVPVKWLRGYGQGRRRSDSSAFSRALRRLEQRGLIVRSNHSTGMPVPKDSPLHGLKRTSADQPHRRADQIVLTEAGRTEAERVSVNIVGDGEC